MSDGSREYVDYPYIKEGVIEKREYQIDLVESGLKDSTLIALPTGTGKTPIAMMISSIRLSNLDISSRRVLVLAPTKPLVEQHANDFREILDIPDNEIRIFNGEVRPDKREELWERPTSVFVATPQVIENDLIAGRISLDKVVHLVFDECHRATGDYSYNYIADMYWEQSVSPLVTALSASPGSDEEKILEVCDNLGMSSIEIYTEEDEKLEKHLEETEIETIRVELEGEYQEIVELLEEPYTDVLKKLKNEFGVINTRSKSKVSERTLQKARKEANKLVNNDDSSGYEAKSYISEARKFLDAITAVKTKDSGELNRLFDKWESEAERGDTKAVKRFISRPNVKEAKRISSNLDKPHPKMEKARAEIARTHMEGGKSLVFTESRSTARRLSEFLDEGPVSAERFVGQNDTDFDTGMSQSEQKRSLERFKEGDIDVLVATSVAEEGLDIPSVDLVLVYEPVAREIRSVQRKGRTGRQRAGRVVVIMTKNSRDEGAYFASKQREKQMKGDLKKLKEDEQDIQDKLEERQSDLGEFEDSTEFDELEIELDEDKVDESIESKGEDEFDDGVVVYADNRETKSKITRILSKDPDIDLRLEQLEVGDYIVSDRCAIERKSASDFVSTLTGEGDRDLFSQLGDMRASYDRPILLLEGELSDFFGRGLHPNAVRGTMIAVILGMNTSPLHARDEEETAKYISMLAKREQKERDREVSAHGNKSATTLAEQQEYIVSSIMDVGPVTAKNLLEHFGTVREVMTATKQELLQVENIGETTADKIVSTLVSPYNPDD